MAICRCVVGSLSLVCHRNSVLVNMAIATYVLKKETLTFFFILFYEQFSIRSHCLTEIVLRFITLSCLHPTVKDSCRAIHATTFQ